jgi:hypothetical protein
LQTGHPCSLADDTDVKQQAIRLAVRDLVLLNDPPMIDFVTITAIT